MSNLLVFCDSKDGKLKPVSRELCSAAQIISAGSGGDIVAVTFGEVADAATLGAVGAKKVVQLTSPELKAYSTEGFAQAGAEIIAAEKPAVVLFAGSSRGRDLAPRVAARTGSALLSDCTELKMDGGALQVQRPIYAGKVLLWCTVNAPCAVLTMRPKSVLVNETGGSAAVESRAVTIDAAKIRALVVEEKTQAGAALDVTEADVVVAGGRGLKGPEGFAMIEELAKVLGGSVGASRAVVDAGWRPHSEQVGQTGKVVAPSLYIAVGISGAVQHLAGMTTSRTIVAVNKDADAPIFKVASYGIVGDAFDVIPALTDAVRKIKAEG
jgi:electron transfer flavoprotein alpha subunit